MEEKRGWYFPNNIGGQDEGFENQGINQFKMSPYGKLAREIIQNSYDAKIKEEDKKVKVEFKLMKIEKNRIPNLESIKEAIEASAEYFSEDDRLEKFKQVANEKIESDTIDVLKISDYNTTGLVGIEKRNKSAWYGLIKSSGNSPKKGITGGSYGSGKHAAFVFSYFRTILYGTYVKDEGYAFQGKTILCAHMKDGVVKGNIGYWGNIDETGCKPIRNPEEIDEIYRRNETGTDLYIIGAKLEKDEWVDNVKYSVIENFWKLLVEDKLEVSIIDQEKEVTINSKNVRTLAQIGKNKNVKIDQKYSFNAYKFIELNDKIEEVRYGSICSENDVQLKIAQLPEYPEKKILKMRDTEMKIKMLSPRKRPINFIGILIATGKELNEQLRESEPQTHDEWNADNVENEEVRAKVAETIKRLDKWLNDQIDSISYTDDIEEFDIEGIDFLDIDDNDSNGMEDIQRPFDEIKVKEEEEQEIMPLSRKKAIIGINKINDQDADAGEDSEEEHTRGNEGKKRKKKQEKDIIDGEIYHAIQMEYIKTPYDSEKNIYRIIIKSTEDIVNGEIHFQRRTDSGELERLEIDKAYLGNEELNISKNKIKNINLKENEVTKLDVIFKNQRKCIMEVKVYVQKQG